MFRINRQVVTSVYSGLPGCCCGCRGKHTYRPTTRDTESARRGYVVMDDEVSERTVARFVNKVNAALKTAKEIPFTAGCRRVCDEGLLEVNDRFVYLDTGARLYIIYF